MILDSIYIGYIFQLAEFSDENTKKRASQISAKLLHHAQEIVDKNFKDILVSHPKEKQIKLACLQYFFAIHLLNSINVKNKAGYRSNLKSVVAEHNQIKDLLDTLQNLDFLIGECGIDAHELALKLR